MNVWGWLEWRAPAARLGMMRAAVGGYALWYLVTRRDTIAEIVRGDPGLFRPAGVFAWLDAPLAPAVSDWMVDGAIATGVLFTLGLAFRFAGPLFALLLLAVLCYRNSWSMLYHSHNLLVAHALVLGVARSADGFSLDRLRRPASGRDEVAYGWPLGLICALTIAAYFLAGFAKVCSEAGWGWVAGSVLREQIGADAVRKYVLEGEAPAVAESLYSRTGFFTFVGVATLVLELGAPLFMFRAWCRRLWAVAVWGMHVGILVVMGILFRYQLTAVVFLPFFTVERLLPERWRRS